MSLLIGCSQQQPSSPSGTSPSPIRQVTSQEHRHHHTAPHQGALHSLGEEFAHLELVLDSATGTLTAYVLDGGAESPIRLPGQVLNIKLDSGTSIDLLPKADELTGETTEDSSTFQAVVTELKDAKTFSGTLAQVEIKGQKFQDVKLKFPEGNEASAGDGHNHDHPHGEGDGHGHDHPHGEGDGHNHDHSHGDGDGHKH